jgi:hypothetical protein
MHARQIRSNRPNVPAKEDKLYPSAATIIEDYTCCHMLPVCTLAVLGTICSASGQAAMQHIAAWGVARFEMQRSGFLAGCHTLVCGACARAVVVVYEA